jgi:hypothetical protein
VSAVWTASITAQAIKELAQSRRIALSAQGELGQVRHRICGLVLDASENKKSDGVISMSDPVLSRNDRIRLLDGDLQSRIYRIWSYQTLWRVVHQFRERVNRRMAILDRVNDILERVPPYITAGYTPEQRAAYKRGRNKLNVRRLALRLRWLEADDDESERRRPG